MTLVCRIEYRGDILILSDVVLSVEGESSEPISLPAFRGKVAQTGEGPKYALVGARRKIEQINQNCLVAWAGSAIHARTFFRELRERVADRPVELSDIDAVLRDWSPKDRSEIALLANILVPSPESASQFGIEFCELNYEEYEIGDLRLVGAGSGMGAFRELVGAIDQSRVLDATEAPVESLRRLALILGSQLYASEVFTHQSLRQAWGGVYEATIVGERVRFEQIGDIAWSFWVSRNADQGSKFDVSLLSKISLLRYFNGHPAFIDIIFDINPNGLAVFRDVSMFSYGSFFGPDPRPHIAAFIDKKVQELDLSYQTLCCAMAAVAPNGGIGVIVKHDSSGEMPIQFQFEEHGIKISVRNDLMQEIASSFSENLDGAAFQGMRLESFPK